MFAESCEAQDGIPVVTLQVKSTFVNPPDSRMAVRNAVLSASLCWSEFKRYPDAKVILERLGKDSAMLHYCLKELEEAPEKANEDYSDDNSTRNNTPGLFSCLPF